MTATGSIRTSSKTLGRHPAPGVEVSSTLDLNGRRQLEVLTFAASSHKIDGMCIGWLTAGAYVGAHNQGRLVACYNNADLVGYILWSCNRGIMCCFVVYVRRDARLLIHGRALVDWIIEEGARRGCTRVELWCAIDLAANLFWAALGFERVCWRWGRAKKSRKHWLWRLRIGHESGEQRRDDQRRPHETARPNPPALLLPT